MGIFPGEHHLLPIGKSITLIIYEMATLVNQVSDAGGGDREGGREQGGIIWGTTCQLPLKLITAT
jgi:hypothetical protein